MKSLKTTGMMAFIAIATIFVSSCQVDTNYYEDNYYQRYSWWDDSYNYPSSDLVLMAQTLRGHWDGQLVARGVDANGYAGVKSYYTDIEFDQYNSNAIYGRGRQRDFEGRNDRNPFTRSFSWHIDNRTRAIVITYDNNYTMTIAYSEFDLNDNQLIGTMRGTNDTDEFNFRRYTLAKKGLVDLSELTDTTTTK